MGTRLQRAGGSGRGSTLLSPWGRVSRDMMDVPRVGKSHGQVTFPPGAGRSRDAAQHVPDQCDTPAKPRWYQALALQCYNFLHVEPPAQQCRASVSPHAVGSAPAPQSLSGPVGGREAAAGPGPGGCRPGCTFGLNPGVPPCTDTSKNNPERGANRRLFIALHP